MLWLSAIPPAPALAWSRNKRPMAEPGKKSYGEILKSSALIGGSAAMVMGFGAVRNKAMAVLLGTTGYGFFGMYITVSELARMLAGLGINCSGVRQIAE